MLPSALPTFLKTRRAPVSLSVMATGYFAVWVASGTGIYALGVAFAAAAMRWEVFSRAVPVLSGASLIAAGAFQFTSWKTTGLAPLPFAIRVRKCLPGTRNQLPPWLQARHGLLPLLRRPDNDSAKAGSEQLSQSCEEFH